MYDIHCHILPGLDDGARDMEDTLDMCRIMAEQGIRAIAATPHFIEGEAETEVPSIFEGASLVNGELKARGIQLEIFTGMEVYMTPNLVKLYEDGKVITLNSTRYMLIELPLYSNLPLYLDDVLFALQLKAVKPIIAHPERCSAIKEHPNRVYRLIEKGCIIQVNSGSIAGSFGRGAQKTAIKLLEHNMVHAISSDNHSSHGRMCYFKDSYRIISKKYGKSLARNLFANNQRMILNGEDIFMKEHTKIKKKRFWLI